MNMTKTAEPPVDTEVTSSPTPSARQSTGIHVNSPMLKSWRLLKLEAAKLPGGWWIDFEASDRDEDTVFVNVMPLADIDGWPDFTVGFTRRALSVCMFSGAGDSRKDESFGPFSGIPEAFVCIREQIDSLLWRLGLCASDHDYAKAAQLRHNMSRDVRVDLGWINRMNAWGAEARISIEGGTRKRGGAARKPIATVHESA